MYFAILVRSETCGRFEAQRLADEDIICPLLRPCFESPPAPVRSLPEKPSADNDAVTTERDQTRTLNKTAITHTVAIRAEIREVMAAEDTDRSLQVWILLPIRPTHDLLHIRANLCNGM
jgi:hypothetical protein